MSDVRRRQGIIGADAVLMLYKERKLAYSKGSNELKANTKCSKIRTNQESQPKSAQNAGGRNHDIATRFKAKKAEAKVAPPESKQPLLIETEKPKNDILTKTSGKI